MTSCIYCGNKNAKELFSLEDIFRDRYHLRECLECETAFLDPSPTKEQLVQAYSEDYYGEGESKFNPTVERIIDFFRQKNAKKMAKLFGGRGTILDIGCGNGSFLFNLGQQGDFQLHGLELEGKSAQRASKIDSIDLTIGELETTTFQENSFDAITLIHVFEHLPNPSKVIEIISNILKSEGVLVVEIPNIDSWQARYFKEDWLHLDPPRHLNFFKPHVLKQIMRENGFEVIQEKYASPQFSPFGVQQSILNKFCKRREVLYEHLKGNSEYVKDYSKANLFIQKLFHWITFPLFILTDMIASAFKKGGTVRLIFRKKIDIKG